MPERCGTVFARNCWRYRDLMTDASPRLAYTPALDGLRAIAVLAVMFYHGGVAVAGGGFLGVDIFFVLSGFLITTLLLLEFEANGRLDLTAFWGRRARRLLPALFLVLVAVLVYSAFLAGAAASTVRSDALATLFYVSNWWFIVSGNSYFEQFQDPSPLTHTWSLAIEEQWYLVLPLVLVLLLPRIRGRRWWAAIFVTLALVSAGLMALLHTPGSEPSREYYGTDTRLLALLIGAGLASVFTPGVIERLRGPARWLRPQPSSACCYCSCSPTTRRSGCIAAGSCWWPSSQSSCWLPWWPARTVWWRALLPGHRSSGSGRSPTVSTCGTGRCTSCSARGAPVYPGLPCWPCGSL